MYKVISLYGRPSELIASSILIECVLFMLYYCHGCVVENGLQKIRSIGIDCNKIFIFVVFSVFSHECPSIARRILILLFPPNINIHHNEQQQLLLLLVLLQLLLLQQQLQRRLHKDLLFVRPGFVPLFIH
jgi:hypothetical protein